MASDDVKSDFERRQDLEKNIRLSELIERVALSDSRVKMLHHAAALFEHNGNLKATEDYENSDLGKLQEQAVVTAVATGKFGGGSSAHMVEGIQRMIVGSNMRTTMSVYGTAHNGMLLGEGKIQDILTEHLFTKIQDSMFNPKTGLGDVTKTGGFDRSQIGEIAYGLGKQGAFAGLDAGLVTLNGETGQLEVKDNIPTAEHIQKSISKTAKLLELVKSITKGKSIAELTAQATALTGMDNNTEAATNVLKKLKTTAIQQNVSYQELAETRIGNINKLVREKGFSSNMAGALTSEADASLTGAIIDSKARAAIARKNGTFSRQFSDEELRNSSLEDRSRAMQENPILAEAGAYLSNPNIGSAKDRETLKAAISAVGKSGTDQERTESATNLAAAVSAVSGVTAGTLTKMIGTKAVQAETSAENSILVAAAANSMITNLTRRNMIHDITQQRGATAEQTKANETFFTAYNSKTQADLKAALKVGDTKKFNEIVDASKDELIAGGMTEAEFENLKTTATSGPKALLDTLEFTDMMGSTRLAALGSKQTEKELEDNKAMTSVLADGAGKDLVTPQGFFTDLTKSVLNLTPITTANKLNYLYSQNKTQNFKYLNGTQTTLTKSKELASILNTFGGTNEFSKALGLKSDATPAEIQNAMRSEIGKKATQEFLKTQLASPEKSKELASILNTFGGTNEFSKALGLKSDATPAEIQNAMQSDSGQAATQEFLKTQLASPEKSKELTSILNNLGGTNEFSKALGLKSDATPEEIQKAMQSAAGQAAAKTFVDTKLKDIDIASPEQAAKLVKQLSKQGDIYTALGIDKNATPEQMQKAMRSEPGKKATQDFLNAQLVSNAGATPDNAAKTVATLDTYNPGVLYEQLKVNSTDSAEKIQTALETPAGQQVVKDFVKNNEVPVSIDDKGNQVVATKDNVAKSTKEIEAAQTEIALRTLEGTFTETKKVGNEVVLGDADNNAVNAAIKLDTDDPEGAENRKLERIRKTLTPEFFKKAAEDPNSKEYKNLETFTAQKSELMEGVITGLAKSAEEKVKNPSGFLANVPLVGKKFFNGENTENQRNIQIVSENLKKADADKGLSEQQQMVKLLRSIDGKIEQRR